MKILILLFTLSVSFNYIISAQENYSVFFVSDNSLEKNRDDFDSKGKRFSIEAGSSYNYISNATTNAIGLADSLSERYNYFLNFGFWLLRGKRMRLGSYTGAGIRNFGFKSNNSKIIYASIPLGLRLQTGKPASFFKLEFYGAIELTRLVNSRYYYLNSSGSSSDYNIFLHQNDAVLAAYGGRIMFGKRRLQLHIFSEKILQVDTYDLQYDKTLGSQGFGIGIRYQ